MTPRAYHHTAYLLALAAIWLLTACGADHFVKKGDKYLALGEYFDAAAEYKTAYNKTDAKEKAKRGEIALKIAQCNSHISQSQKAIAAYRNAVRYGSATANDHLDLARQLMKNGNYREAAKEYQTAIDSLTNADALALAQQGLHSALTAQEEKEAGSAYTVKRMDALNSRRADYSPMLFGDNYEYLYFSSTRNDAEGDELSGITGMKPGDIFYVQKDDKGKWGKAEQIVSGLNTEYDEGACCFTPDGREMYITQCTSDPDYPRNAQIATSARSDAAWGAPKALTITADTLSSYAHPAISPDGAWLYFASDMPGGKGGFDIWRVRITSAGLGGVENHGEPINTAGDELFPTFRPNGDLYFSSDGHQGLGGLDIYFVAPLRSYHAEGSAATPTTSEDCKVVGNVGNGLYLMHPGDPLNSAGDDFGMTFEGLHNRGFFASNRGDARGWDHIYSFEKPEVLQTVKGWVYELDGYELPAAQVHMVGSDGTNTMLSVKGDASFTHEIQPNTDYIFLATCPGYLNHKEELTVQPVTSSEEYVLQFPLASIRVPVLIDNIFYDFNKHTLRPESEAALDQLVTMLNENPNVTIELSAHCDYKGSADYNRRLSQRRAESVVNYLTEHGIAADRLTPVGYGEDKPKTIRKRLAAKYKWLKEDDVLTEEFILALDPDKQETANQLNRRTEFLVLRTTYGMFDAEGNLIPQTVRPTTAPASDDDDFWDIEEW